MRQLDLNKVTEYVNNNINTFHQSRINKLKKLKLKGVLRRKNPYLFKAKNILKAQNLVESILDAYLSSSEEELFGVFLEGLSVYIAAEVFGGKKSAATGIDLEFERDNVRYLVSVKSGTNWGNKDQKAKLRENFGKAVQTLKQGNSLIQVETILGMCYGRVSKEQTQYGYVKKAGARFWEFISGNAELYTEIIEPIGHEAKKHNDKYEEEKSIVVNRFTQEFSQEFCSYGKIDWKKLVVFNSGNLKKD